MREENRIFQKLLDAYGKGVYIIISYDYDPVSPKAIIEHIDGTPTTLHYNMVKGKWE
jgi:hypothetical protein